MSQTIGTSSPFDAAQIIDSLDAGLALPSNWYTDAPHFAHERDIILRRSWHYAAHIGELATVGDQIVTDVAGVPVVLLCDESNEIRGFVNICRHRAHPVVLESGNRKTLQCLYHGWTYNLDGCLRRAPRAESELDFDPGSLGLVPVQVAVWGPTVWVNVDLGAPSFNAWISGLPELVERRGLDLQGHSYAFERSWTIRTNWKVFLDNATECYHCPTCHPGIASALEMDPDLQDFLIGGRYWISHSIPYRRDAWRKLYPNKAALSDRAEPPLYHFHWIFPLTYLQYKGAEEFDIGTIAVEAVDRIRFRHLVFLPLDATPEERESRRERLDADMTIPEDIQICERVQRSHEADFAPPGRLLSRSESLLQHFQRVEIEMMLAREPSPITSTHVEGATADV
jgi:phenylpropionate dioxygenase-like ring-hydroxylating dioxygenase large terminal subunit